jgi:hypothetical protein
MTTTTNTNDDLVVSCAHALGASWCWLVFNRPRWCYAVLVVVCVIHPPLQLATWSHACIQIVCMYCISPSMAYVRTPTAAGGIEILLFALQ